MFCSSPAGRGLPEDRVPPGRDTQVRFLSAAVIVHRGVISQRSRASVELWISVTNARSELRAWSPQALDRMSLVAFPLGPRGVSTEPSGLPHPRGEAVAWRAIVCLRGRVTSLSHAAREIEKKVTSRPFDVSRVALNLRQGDLT
jgi:hypothetical protein